MLGGRQTIFLTPYFQFEKIFYFLFVYVMNTCDYFLCLPSWHHGKWHKLSWKSHGILLSDLCGNPAFRMSTNERSPLSGVSFSVVECMIVDRAVLGSNPGRAASELWQSVFFNKI